jgi:uncharacterized protein YdhG (YjbR/CyaY superfamily)
MILNSKKPTTIEQYIEGCPEELWDRLNQMVACIREAAPNAKEGMKWNMPAFSYDRILVTFAVFEHHIGFYPTPSAVAAFAKSLTGYKTAKGSIQFPIDKPLPLDLIRKITLFRVHESLGGDVKWRS